MTKLVVSEWVVAYLTVDDVPVLTPSFVNPVEAANKLAVALLADAALPARGVGGDRSVLGDVKVRGS